MSKPIVLTIDEVEKIRRGEREGWSVYIDYTFAEYDESTGAMEGCQLTLNSPDKPTHVYVDTIRVNRGDIFIFDEELEFIPWEEEEELIYVVTEQTHDEVKVLGTFTERGREEYEHNLEIQGYSMLTHERWKSGSTYITITETKLDMG